MARNAQTVRVDLMTKRKSERQANAKTSPKPHQRGWPLRAANRSSDEKPQMTAVSPKQKRHAIKQKDLLAPEISGQQSYSISEDRAQRLISSSELTSSILASSASENSKFWTAPTQSTICSGREAPIRAVVIRSPLSTQASAI